MSLVPTNPPTSTEATRSPRPPAATPMISAGRPSTEALGPSELAAGQGVQQGDYLWTQYLEVASTVDARLVADWTTIIDVILVYIALFSGVLTAFIIETSKEFERDPIAVSNDLLIALYKRSIDPSSAPIDLDKIFDVDPDDRSRAVYRNTLLYVSLGLSIVVSALAASCKLWVIRYNSAVNATGSPFERAMARQKAYSGMQAWKLEVIVEALPLLSLLAVFVFGHFVHDSLEKQRKIRFAFDIESLLGLAFILALSFCAAFIPSAPFQSAFSDSIQFLFRIFPESPTINIGKQRSIRVRTVMILVASLLCFLTGGWLSIAFSGVFIPIAFFPVAGVLALMRPGQEKDMKPRVFDIPQLILASILILITTLSLAAYFHSSRSLFLLFFILMAVLLCIKGYIGMKMSQSVPKATEAVAVAWMITSSAAQDVSWYQKAVEIAGDSPNLRALLLKELLPLLTPLIISSHGDSQVDVVTPEQGVYIACLAKLADFRPSKGDLLRNEAPLRHGALSTPLLMKLIKLTQARCQCPDSLAVDEVGLDCSHGSECVYRRVRQSATSILRSFREDEDEDQGQEEEQDTVRNREEA